MVSTEVETLEPVEAPPRAPMATELSCWLRKASALASAALAVAGAPRWMNVPQSKTSVVVVEMLAVPLGAAAALLALDALLPITKAPAAAAVDWLPLTLPPEVEMKMSRRVSGFCQNCRRHLHHHIILVLVLVDGGDLALAEGVIQGVVDLLRY